MREAVRMMERAGQAGWMALAERISAEIAKTAAAHDADDSFVADAYALLKREGLFKAHVPAELGGGGASYRELAQIIRILARGCSSTGLAFAMHSHIVALNSAAAIVAA